MNKFNVNNQSDYYAEDQSQQFRIDMEYPPEANEATRDAMFAISTHVAASMSIAQVQGQTVSIPNDLSALAKELTKQSRAKGTGEEILHTQAITLDLVFNQLLGRAINQKDLNVTEMLLRLAFKAQTQCRSTLAAISEIRHPRIHNHIAQMNNTSGHQQVNNCAPTRTGKTEKSKVEVEIENPPNELSEGLTDDISQNFGTSKSSEGADQYDSAMEVFNRTENG